MKRAKIDKESKLPLHYQIYEDIKNKIINNELQAGVALPSEGELQELYGVSRITVRRAIQDLEIEELVKKYQGKGTFVLTPKHRFDLRKLSSFSEDVKKYGEISSSIIRDFRIVKVDFKIADSLDISEGDDVYYLERIRLSGDTAVGLHKAYIKMSSHFTLNETEFDETTSLYETLKGKGVDLKYANEILEAQMPDDEIKNSLGMKDHTPIFYKERTTYDSSNFPVEYVEMYYRSDVYQYRVTLDVNDEK
ncbi:MAG TPA: GntR family transcriptional regulator [Neobacillus sp.]|jgi:GntR family transcriptional regulator